LGQLSAALVDLRIRRVCLSAPQGYLCALRRSALDCKSFPSA
jgi:hypothetical protein